MEEGGCLPPEHQQSIRRNAVPEVIFVCQQDLFLLLYSQRSLSQSHSSSRSFLWLSLQQLQQQWLLLQLLSTQDRFLGTLPTPMPKNPRQQPKLQRIVWPPVIKYSGESPPRNILCSICDAGVYIDKFCCAAAPERSRGSGAPIRRFSMPFPQAPALICGSLGSRISHFSFSSIPSPQH